MEKFQLLSGASIGEHKKQFNLFLQYLKQLPKEEINKFIINLTSRNRQEENFRVKIIIELGSSNDILRILKEGDRISTRILLKNVIDIEKLFFDVSGDDLINNICPYLSYVTRNRLINKLSFTISDESKGEEYFKAVYCKYGIRIAQPLLIACSDAFIREYIDELKIMFSERQLIRLHMKSDSFLHFYFKTISNHNFFNCNLLGQYLSINAVDTLWGLLNYGIPFIGRRGLLNVIEKYKQNIIEEPMKYKTILKPYVLKKHLTFDEFNTLFMNLFDKNVDKIRYNTQIKMFLKVIPKQERYKLLCKSFNQVYKIDYTNDKCRLPLEFFAIEDQRLIVENIADYDIDLIKEKINLTSDIRKRGQLLEQLLETCRLYNDQEKLLEVLKYFIVRHKNDNVDLRNNFLSKLADKFLLINLTKEHWIILLDLLKIFEVHGECFNDKNRYLSGHILWKLQRGEEYFDDLKIIIKNQGVKTKWTITSDEKYERMLLLRCPEFLEEIFPNELDEAILQFIYTIDAWNSNHSKLTISYYNYPKYLMKFIQRRNQYWSVETNIILFNPVLQEEKIFKKQFLLYYLEIHVNTLSNEIMLWLLKYKPALVLKYAKEICKQDCDDIFYYEISKMHYHAIYTKFRKFALILLDNLDTTSIGLKFLSYEKDFLKIIEKFKPNDININKNDAQTLLKIQIDIIRYLKNPSNHENSLEVIVNYCQNDYLQYALNTLYYALEHSREMCITIPIAQIADKAVSVRKHAIHLTTTLGSMQLIITTLTNMMQNEKNPSVRQFILKNTYRILIKESSNDLWQLLKAQMQVLKPNDDESIELLTNIDGIPKKIIADYLQQLWNYLMKCDNDKELIVIRLLNTDLINLLTNKFCKEMLDKAINNLGWDQFVCEYLFSNQSTMENRQKLIFDCIIEKGVYNIFTVLIDTICRKLINRPDCAVAFITLLQENVHKLALPYDKFDLELLIQTTNSFLQNETSLKNLAEIYIQQQVDLVGKFGPEILDYHYDFVNQFLGMVRSKFDSDNTLINLELCENMLLVTDSDHVKMLMMKLLPTKAIKDLDFNQRRTALINKLENNASPLIKVYLFKFKKMLG